MINFKDFYNLLFKFKLINPIWDYILEIIDNEIKDKENKDEYLIIFTIYFSLIDEGNICISLDEKKLKQKWFKRVNQAKILFEDKEDFLLEEYQKIIDITNYCLTSKLNNINHNNLPKLIGDNKMFDIDDGYLYIKQYNVSRLGIINSIKRLYSNNEKFVTNFNYKDCIKDGFNLSKGQEKAIIEGVGNNLIITGGPGTGKTTSILFLLLNLLENSKEDRVIYLIAPSGKASSRMKESIINGLVLLKDEYKNTHLKIIDIINNLEESTIHRLLGIDYETNGFLYNKNHQFVNNSLFIIDEASMIDINLFNSLLEAIPNSARVFIMGDKNQLPSVECGAVFAELLKIQSLKNNIIELDESIRFKKGTKIFELAYAVNNGLDLPVEDKDWKDYLDFQIMPDDNNKPIFYFRNYKDNVKDKDIIQYIIKIWGQEYYSSLQDKCTDLDFDITYLNELFAYSETSKVLCAENESVRGVKSINKYIKKLFIDISKVTSVPNYYPGMIMMINKNNKMLDLYNGDTGILVTFKNDRTLYFMVKKSTSLVKENGKIDNQIFKMGDFTFYPLRLIAANEIDMAYAITIHKSQGSDYKNILVILPKAKGHPLLNRQIIYTAITRTKGNTYILSNQERLEESKDFIIERDTNISI